MKSPHIYMTRPFPREKPDRTPQFCLALIILVLFLSIASGQTLYAKRQLEAENEVLTEQLEFYKSYCLPV